MIRDRNSRQEAKGESNQTNAKRIPRRAEPPAHQKARSRSLCPLFPAKKDAPKQAAAALFDLPCLSSRPSCSFPFPCATRALHHASTALSNSELDRMSQRRVNQIT